MNEMNQNQGSRELQISRLLDAPRELVWEVWTQPQHIAQWWGPNGFSNSIAKMDVTEGGEWEFIMHGPDGTDYKNKHIYIELVKPERIVLEHVTTPKFRMHMHFEEQGNKTLLHIRSEFESAEQLEQVIKVFKADEGLKQNVDRLESYLEKAKSAPIIIERLLKAPVEKVWRAISDRDEMAKWYFDLAAFKAEKDFSFQFPGGEPGKEYLHLCTVTEVLPLKKLCYTWRYDGYEGDSLVSFELFDEGGQTRLVLTHSGIQTFPASNPDLARKNFVMGWSHIIPVALANYVEA